jgi:hypothetical protein
MSEQFLDRLSRFTPDAGKLNRDALLFEAGRRSMRPNRAWKTAASVLAVTQCLSLVLLLPGSRPEHSVHSVVQNGRPALSAPIDQLRPAPSVIDGSWSLRSGPTDVDAERHLSGNVTLIESGQSLRAFLRPPDSLLN